MYYMLMRFYIGFWMRVLFQFKEKCLYNVMVCVFDGVGEELCMCTCGLVY